MSRKSKHHHTTVDVREWVINGVPCYSFSEVPSLVLSQLPNLRYWSPSALCYFYVGLLQMVVEAAKLLRDELTGPDKSKITRIINSTERRLLQPISSSPEGILSEIYNYALDREGLGTLHGFGVGNRWGDRIPGNPEREPIVKVISIQPITGGRIIMAKKMNKKDLVRVVEELNDVLGLDPEIDTSLPLPVLSKLTREATELIEPGEDEFSESTMQFLYTHFNVEFPEDGEEVVEMKAEEAKVRIEFDEDEEEVDEDEEEVDEDEEEVDEDEEEVVEMEAEEKPKPKPKSATKVKPKPKSASKAKPKPEGAGKAKPKPEGAGKAKPKPEGAGKAKPKTWSASKARREFIENILKKKRAIPKNELVDLVLEEFDVKKSTVTTELSDGKNPKYCKFSRLLEIRDGVVSFSDEEE